MNAGQVVNNRKVTDHHAIIPTKELQKCTLSGLPKGEAEVLKLIVQRFLTAVSEPCKTAETTAEILCGNAVFKAKGKTVLSAGWKGIEEKCSHKKRKEKENVLPSMKDNCTLPLLSAEIKEGKTVPPKHFTDVIFCERKEWIGIEERSSA